MVDPAELEDVFMPQAPHAERMEFFKHFHAYALLRQAGWVLHRASKLETDSAEPQLIYTLWTAFYVLYAKPFRQRKTTGIRIDETIVPARYMQEHQELMKIRDKLVAHSDIHDFKRDDDHPVESVRLTFATDEIRPDLTIMRPSKDQFVRINNLIAAVATALLGRCDQVWGKWSGTAVLLRSQKYHLNISRSSDDILVPVRTVKRRKQ